MVSKSGKRKAIRARSKKDIFIEVRITKGRREQTIRSTNPNYVIRRLKEEY